MKATSYTRFMKAVVAVILLASLAGNSLLAYKVWTGEPKTPPPPISEKVVVMRTPGGLLEVSTITAEERFDSTTSNTVLGVPVGSTVAQIRVPAVYRYHIPLAKDWTFRVMGESLVVVAPAVKPALPVAIDTGKLQSFSSGLWSPITGAGAVTSLQQSITAALGVKAESPPLILLQRESARKTVAEFVQKWVVEQPRWKGSKAPVIFVFFADEPLGLKAVPLLQEGP